MNAGLTAGFTETANPNFSTTFSCTNGVTGTGTVIAPFNVAAGANITCTFVNTRLTGQIKVIKELRPSNDPGRFNIFADGAVLANAGDASVLAPVTFFAGQVVPVGETGGTAPATDLRNYTTTIGCVVENTGEVVVAAGTPLTGDLTRQLNVTVRPGVTIACTLTNTRATGNVTVVKSATGGPFDAGQTFTFTRTGTGASGTVILAPGGSSTVAVNAGLTAGFTETANPNFSTTFSCTNGVTGTGTVIAPFNVAAGANITCTFVNTRLTGQHARSSRTCGPSNDPGRFNIFADGAVLANAGDASGAGAGRPPSPAQAVAGGRDRRDRPGHRPAQLHDDDRLPGSRTPARWSCAGTPLTGTSRRQLNVTVRRA